jgi:hypothetical protein
MHLLLAAVLTAACPSGDVCPGKPYLYEPSYLYQPAFCMDHELRCPARPYHPQPGDIFLASDHGFLAKASHRFGLTGCPQHSGVVVARSDGRMAVLEAGPFNTTKIELVDLVEHLSHYAEHERVWIRARRVPLCPEQCARLTAFAECADGKPFAIVRLLLLGTPFRPRGPVRTAFMGKPRSVDFEPGSCDHGLKKKYFCSELATESLVAAWVLDPETTRPAATFPRDLFFGRSCNCWIDHHLDLSDWDPPARWTLCPGSEPACKRRRWLDGDGPGPHARRRCDDE